jgi:hypothetical protein
MKPIETNKFEFSFTMKAILALLAAFALTNCASGGASGHRQGDGRIRDQVKCSSSRNCNSGNH